MFSACSSIAVHEPMKDNHNKKLRLAYCISSSSEVSIINADSSDEENADVFNKTIVMSIKDINKQTHLAIHYPQYLSLSELEACPDKIEYLKPNTDLFLKIELSGYGALKQEWKNVLIGTGIGEGIVQGVVVGAATSNPLLGILVGAEEITSEYLTWNGVDWLLGENYAPVTLEATLHYIKNNEVIWHDSSFVTDNEDALNDIEKKSKSLQLKASLHQAEKDVFSSLNDYIKSEIIKDIP